VNFHFGIISKFVLIFVVGMITGSHPAWASHDPLSQIKPPPEPESEFFNYRKPSANQIDLNRSIAMDSLSIDRDRMKAQQMVNMLQDQELGKAFKKVTEQGMRTIKENPGIQAPIYVISAAASFWAGKTFDLLREESLRFTAKFEGRSRRSEFSMLSPIMNGSLKFEQSTGLNVSIHRDFDQYQTQTFLNYNMNNQSVSTEVRYRLMKNLDLSVGASRLDQNTKIEYRFNF